MSHRRRLPSANHNCQSPLSIAKTQIAHYKTTVPILHFGDQSQRHDDYSAVIPVRYPKIGAYTG